jgi:hypothetical protein
VRSKRPAFVLNELAVALVVLTMLGGLLFHTVQRVCAASERTRSQQRAERAAGKSPAARPKTVRTRPGVRRSMLVSITKANHPFAKDR